MRSPRGGSLSPDLHAWERRTRNDVAPRRSDQLLVAMICERNLFRMRLTSGKGLDVFAWGLRRRRLSSWRECHLKQVRSKCAAGTQRLPSEGPTNKGSPSRFVCRITVSTHTLVVSCVFQVSPSRCVLFVEAIQKELPITLLVIKGL